MPDLLVIGFGNTLRGDDGIGPAVAREVNGMGLAGVRTMAVHQLTPELAADVADANLVIFVDAAADEEVVRVTRLTTDDHVAGASFTHAASPRVILALAQAVYGRCPEAWLVAVGGTSFDAHDGLSDTALNNLRQAREHVRALCETCSPSVAHSDSGKSDPTV